MAFIAAGGSVLTRVPFRRRSTQKPSRSHLGRSPIRRARVRSAATPEPDGGRDESTSPPAGGKAQAESENPFTSILSALSSVGDALAEAALAPLGSCSVLAREWEALGGNLVLRPAGRARAVLHFVGGAFVGAAPHIAYRSLLERLAGRGYCVVAVPYDLSLDYLATAAGIADAWERVETDLALEYGAVPVVGLGHSAGALQHALLSALFADACPRAANILVSFNNKPAADAIPLYDAVFAPAFASAARAEQALPAHAREAIAAAPDAVADALRRSPLVPRPVRDSVLPTLREARRVLDQIAPLVREIGGVPRAPPQPDAAPEARADAEAGAKAEAEVTPGAGEEAEPRPEPRARGVAPEFYPPPSEVQAAVEAMYSAGQTLVVRFTGDEIDESGRIEAMVRARGGGGGGGAEGDTPVVTLVELPGTHVTPLAQDIPRPVIAGAEAAAQGVRAATQQPAAGILPLAAAVSAALQEVADAAGGKDMQRLEELIDEWVQAGIANGYL